MRGIKRNSYKTSSKNHEEIMRTIIFVRGIILLQEKDSNFWNRRHVYFFKLKFISKCRESCLANRHIHCSENTK